VTRRLTETELRAWQALLHAHHDVTSRLDAELRRDHELSLGAYDVLLRLARADGGSLAMTELAKRVMVSPSTLTRKVDGLTARGLIERMRGRPDARVVLVGLTAEGRRLVRRAATTHLRGIREHFAARLTDEQLRAVASSLEVIAGTHEDH
jgi:DNA-binding MarR family transcriptional regulator